MGCYPPQPMPNRPVLTVAAHAKLMTRKARVWTAAVGIVVLYLFHCAYIDVSGHSTVYLQGCILL